MAKTVISGESRNTPHERGSTRTASPRGMGTRGSPARAGMRRPQESTHQRHQLTDGTEGCPGRAGINRSNRKLLIFIDTLPRTRGDKPSVRKRIGTHSTVHPGRTGMNRRRYGARRAPPDRPRTRGDRPRAQITGKARKNGVYWVFGVQINTDLSRNDPVEQVRLAVRLAVQTTEPPRNKRRRESRPKGRRFLFGQ